VKASGKINGHYGKIYVVKIRLALNKLHGDWFMGHLTTLFNCIGHVASDSRITVWVTNYKRTWEKAVVACFKVLTLQIKVKVKLSLCFNWVPRHEGVLGK
jgi:hypothetical protein